MEAPTQNSELDPGHRLLILVRFAPHKTLATLVALSALSAWPVAARGQTTPPDSGLTVRGIVVDSAQGGVLAGAVVQLQPTRREALTDSTGHYRFTGVRPGEYTLRVLHLRLDTLGIAVVTPPIRPDGSRPEMVVDISVPPVMRLLPTYCTPAQMLRGPAALIGFVRDPDTELPIDSARVTLMFEVNQDPLGLKKETSVRQATTDAAGRYRICGLPADLLGKLQVQRQGITTPDIPIDYSGARLVIRGLAFSKANAMVNVTTATGTVRMLTGPARLAGRVVNKQGEPVRDARVTILGSNSVVVTRSNGTFSLDSLPVGSQVVEVRKVGFGVTTKPIELSAVTTPTVDVTLEDYIPTLDAVKTVGIMERDLEKVGYLRRKQSAGGYHFDGEQINTRAETFTQSLVGFPSVKVIRGGEWADQYRIQDARDPTTGCVVFFVDGSQWKSLTPGDIDQFVKPYEVKALEFYRAGTLPAEFAAVGSGRCLTIVIWTKNKIRGGG